MNYRTKHVRDLIAGRAASYAIWHGPAVVVKVDGATIYSAEGRDLRALRRIVRDLRAAGARPAKI